jgi:hypothetical protein
MADIPVNQNEWNALSAPDKQKITDIMKHLKLIDGGDRFVPDAAKAATVVPAANPFCLAACDGLYAAAVSACAAYTGPTLAACLAAATAAHEVCRSRC